jgi:hypothetical protein
MKKMTIMANLGIPISLLLFTLLIMIISNCSIKREEKPCSCSGYFFKGKVEFIDNNQSAAGDVNIYPLDFNGKKFSLAVTAHSSSLLVFSEKFLRRTGINTDKNCFYGLIFYVDKLLEKQNSISDSNIAGISLFEFNKKRLFHRLFVKEKNGSFSEDVEYNIEVPGITAKHTIFYLEKRIFTDLNGKSCITIATDRNHHLLRPSPKLLSKLKYQRTELKEGNPVNGCGTLDACVVGMKNDICALCPQYDQYMCYMNCGPCPSSTVQDILDGDSSSSYIDLPLQYLFRDSVLSSTDMGQRYISTFYNLGRDLDGHWNFSLALTAANGLSRFNTLMQKLCDTTGYSRDTLITESDRDFYLSILAEFKETLTDSISRSDIDLLISDVNEFTNLKLSDFLITVQEHE